MKICIMTERFPYPEIGGDSLRANNVAKYLKRQGHTLVLLSFYGEKKIDMDAAKLVYDKVYLVKLNRIEAFINSLLSLLKGMPIQVGYYNSPRYLTELKMVDLVENIDIFIPRGRVAEYLIKAGFQKRTIVEKVDALSKTYSLIGNKKGSVVKRIIYSIEKRLIPKNEEHLLREFPKVVFVSPTDVKYLQEKYPWQKSAMCHTNGFEIPEEVVDDYNPLKICIMGNMRTLQNQDAAFFFAKEVFPLILKERPESKYYIVGAEPSKQIMDLANEHIIVTGFVENVEDVLRDACLCVAPVRIAAGIQNKVLVSMGCGVPVVMSSLISQPISQLISGVNCFVEDDPQKMANICLEIMTNKELRRKIGEAGRQMIKDNYSWDKTLENYLNIGGSNI